MSKRDVDRQCHSCGGFCKPSGCERENVKDKEDALLRQALEALEMSQSYLDTLSEKMFGGPKKAKPASTSWYVRRAIEALRRRLGNA